MAGAPSRGTMEVQPTINHERGDPMDNNAQWYFTANLRAIGKDSAGKPKDPLAWNLNYGLLELAKQLDAIQAEQVALRSGIANPTRTRR